MPQTLTKHKKFETEEEKDASSNDSNNDEPMNEAVSDSEEDDKSKDYSVDLEEAEEQIKTIPFSQLAELKKNGIASFKPKKEKEAKKQKEGKDGESKKKSKNAPTEMSSKNPISRFRVVVPSKQTFKARDPRFEETSGHFNEDLFKKSYSFIYEYQEAEISALKKEISSEKDPERKKKLQVTLSSMISRKKAEKVKQEKKKQKSEWLKKEREAVSKGKKAFYLKKSDERKLELIAKFNELKKNKRLEKFMEKRVVKNAKKDKKLMPFERRNTE